MMWKHVNEEEEGIWRRPSDGKPFWLKSQLGSKTTPAAAGDVGATGSEEKNNREEKDDTTKHTESPTNSEKEIGTESARGPDFSASSRLLNSGDGSS